MTPASALADLLPEPTPARIGVALSAGGDSMALTVLMADWAAVHGVALHAVTVDHGLRPGSADEAASAASVCATLGIAHDTLHWHDAAGSGGNLQDRARRARYRLIGEWARSRGIAHVTLGHTRDDQAETVLLRLARGSGVDGLSGMAARREAEGVTWLRPFLGVSRAALRELLEARGIGWCEDPSNTDPRFDRVRAREALAALAPIGITREGLVKTAHRMRSAREALERTSHDLAQRVIRLEDGDVVADAAGLFDAPEELSDRLLAHALCWVASAEYRPRHKALRRLTALLRTGRGGTLHGCRVTVGRGEIRVFREYVAVRAHRSAPGVPWDGRWRLTGPAASGLHVAALGPEGLAQCPQWRETGRPREPLLASPAVWEGAHLVAAPLAGQACGWRAELVHGPEDFFAALLSH